MSKSRLSFSGRAPACVRVLAALTLFTAASGPHPQAQSFTREHSAGVLKPWVCYRLNSKAARPAAGGGQGLPGAIGQNLGGNLGRFDPLAPKEPIIVDPSRAYTTVSDLPGAPFAPVSYATNSIIEQLAHSSDGVVQLPPGDYSIPVHLY